MDKKGLAFLSNIIFAVTLLFSMYVLIKIYSVNSKLPPGVCPLENFRPWIYAALGLAVISLITSYISEK